MLIPVGHVKNNEKKSKLIFGLVTQVSKNS